MSDSDWTPRQVEFALQLGYTLISREDAEATGRSKYFDPREGVCHECGMHTQRLTNIGRCVDCFQEEVRTSLTAEKDDIERCIAKYDGLDEVGKVFLRLKFIRALDSRSAIIQAHQIINGIDMEQGQKINGRMIKDPRKIEQYIRQQIYDIQSTDKFRELVTQVDQIVKEHSALTSAMLDQEFQAVATAKITDFVDWREEQLVIGVDKKGNPIRKKAFAIKVRSSDEIDPHLAGAIKEISMTKYGPKIVLHDKLRAGEVLGRRFDEYHQKAHVLTSKTDRAEDNEPLSAEEMAALDEQILGGING